MPFVTEELWQHVRPANSARSLMLSAWPTTVLTPEEERGPFDEAAAAVGRLTQLVSSIRNARAEFGVAPGALVDVTVKPLTEAFKQFSEPLAAKVKALAKVNRLIFDERAAVSAGAVADHLDGADLFVHLGGAVDLQKARTKKQQELSEDLRVLAELQRRLTDDEFVRKAPDEVLQKEQERKRKLEERTQRLEAYLKLLT